MVAISIEYVSPDTDRAVEHVPSTNPSVTSETLTSTPCDDDTIPGLEDTTTTSKKKKKKKSKKSTKSKGESSTKPVTEDDEPSPLVLRISRNKHWRYISSYHVCRPPLTCLTSRFTREIRVHGFSFRWSSSNRSSFSISTRLHFSPNHALHRCLLPNNKIILSLLCAIAATRVSETLPRPTLRDSPSPR